LIVGDLRVNRNWVLPDRSVSVTSQSHGDVLPRKLIDPGWQTDVLGGAACVSDAPHMSPPYGGIPVYLAGERPVSIPWSYTKSKSNSMLKSETAYPTAAQGRTVRIYMSLPRSRMCTQRPGSFKNSVDGAGPPSSRCTLSSRWPENIAYFAALKGVKAICTRALLPVPTRKNKT
jgi:hypothetical protein